MKSLAAVSIGIAAGGVILCAYLNLSLLTGHGNPLGEGARYLFYALFVIWIPALIVSESAAKGRSRNDSWKEALEFCPPWMRLLVPALFAYAIVNVVLAQLGIPELDEDLAKIRLNSGVFAALFGGAMGVLVSFVNADTRVPHCINGHRMNRSARFCGVCGQSGSSEGEPGRPD